MDLDAYCDEISRGWPPPGEPPTSALMEMCFQAVAEHPESSDLWYWLGVLMARSGEDRGYTPPDYLRCFENAIRCDPTDAEAHQEVGYVLDVYFDDYEKAEQAFQRAIDLGAGQQSYYGRARTLAEMGRTTDALNSLAEGACPFHDHPQIQQLRSEILDGEWNLERGKSENSASGNSTDTR